MVAMLCLLFNADLYGLPIRLLGVVLIYVACLLSLWSMWQYIQLAIPKFKK
jgi:phosphatidylglycerophosphate synthase